MEKDAQIVEEQIPGMQMARAFFEGPPELVAPHLLGKILVHRIELFAGKGYLSSKKLEKHGAGDKAQVDSIRMMRGINPRPTARNPRPTYLAGRIVEVEAYLGPHNERPDPAAHSHRGPTPRNQVLFGPAGHAYVYSIYGRYFCMNVSCEKEGHAGCVLVRALEPLAGPDTASFAEMARNRGLAAGAAARELTAGPSRLCQALGITRAAHNGLDLLDPESALQVRDDGYRVSEMLVTTRIGINHAVDLPLRFALPEHRCVSGPRSLTGSRSIVR
jgi:DNA-3-methyladenine glycosylase